MTTALVPGTGDNTATPADDTAFCQPCVGVSSAAHTACTLAAVLRGLSSAVTAMAAPFCVTLTAPGPSPRLAVIAAASAASCVAFSTALLDSGSVSEATSLLTTTVGALPPPLPPPLMAAVAAATVLLAVVSSKAADATVTAAPTRTVADSGGGGGVGGGLGGGGAFT